ncbi:hypothetical protein L7F22_005062 [Adiantum nelumboides]|nr:hypothetical protein [Adiantum nelumboides]
MDAKDIARLKERKIRYELQQREADQEEEGMALVPPTNAPAAHRGQGNQDQQELLSRITHQLEDLLVHLVRGGRGSPPNQEQARGPRRQAQEYHSYNCGENGHGMYYCPHPRRIGNFRGPRNQVSLPRERQQQQPPFPIQQAPPVQILRPPMQPQPQQPPPPPPLIAPIPPLPIPENRAVNLISLDAKVKAEEEERGKSFSKDKGKAKVEDVDAMPIKRARQEEAAMSETGERRKSKENGENSSKKKSKPRRKLTIKDFALGESSQPYNLVDDVSVQGPKITWAQLLHLAPKVRRQWTKMVSMRCVKTKAMGLVSGRNLQDITPVLNAYVKEQRVSNVYVDGGAQICVTTKQTMHRLGLKVNAPAPCKAKMANNSKVKCLGVINALKIKKPKPIDWEFYRKRLNPGIVDMFQKSYDSLKIPKYEDTVTPEYKKKFDALMAKVTEQEEISRKKIAECKENLKKLREEKEALTTMTADKYFAKHPELKAKFDEEIRNHNWGY